MIKKTLVFDTECYLNYWLLMFMDIDSGSVMSVEIINDNFIGNREKVIKILKKSTLISFNGIGYDMPMIALALKKNQDVNII